MLALFKINKSFSFINHVIRNCWHPDLKYRSLHKEAICRVPEVVVSAVPEILFSQSYSMRQAKNQRVCVNKQYGWGGAGAGGSHVARVSVYQVLQIHLIGYSN